MTLDVRFDLGVNLEKKNKHSNNRFLIRLIRRKKKKPPVYTFSMGLNCGEYGDRKTHRIPAWFNRARKPDSQHQKRNSNYPTAKQTKGL